MMQFFRDTLYVTASLLWVKFLIYILFSLVSGEHFIHTWETPRHLHKTHANNSICRLHLFLSNFDVYRTFFQRIIILYLHYYYYICSLARSQASTKVQTFLHRQFRVPLPSCENACFSTIFKWAKTARIVTFSGISTATLCTLLSKKMTYLRILQGLGLVLAPWPNTGHKKQK